MPWEVWEKVIDEDFTEYHVLPDYGPRHELSMQCWCHPKRDEPPTLIVHNEGH